MTNVRPKSEAQRQGTRDAESGRHFLEKDHMLVQKVSICFGLEGLDREALLLLLHRVELRLVLGRLGMCVPGQKFL